MNMNIFFLFNLMVVFSFKPDKTRFCYNCKHFIDSESGVEFGKCGAFPKIDNDYKNYLVTGKRDAYISNDNYQYCGVARMASYMCGEDGSLYRVKYTKNLVNPQDEDN